MWSDGDTFEAERGEEVIEAGELFGKFHGELSIQEGVFFAPPLSHSLPPGERGSKEERAQSLSSCRNLFVFPSPLTGEGQGEGDVLLRIPNTSEAFHKCLTLIASAVQYHPYPSAVPLVLVTLAN